MQIGAAGRQARVRGLTRLAAQQFLQATGVEQQ
jgi:hypothetical protein